MFSEWRTRGKVHKGDGRDVGRDLPGLGEEGRTGA